MKKLKLKALEFGATEVLTRAQLKNVLGGDGSGSGSGSEDTAYNCVSCEDASTCWNDYAQCRESLSCPSKGKVCSKTWWV